MFLSGARFAVGTSPPHDAGRSTTAAGPRTGRESAPPLRSGTGGWESASGIHPLCHLSPKWRTTTALQVIIVKVKGDRLHLFTIMDTKF